MLLGALAVAVMRFCPRGLWVPLAGRYGVALLHIRRKLREERPASAAPEAAEARGLAGPGGRAC